MNDRIIIAAAVTVAAHLGLIALWDYRKARLIESLLDAYLADGTTDAQRDLNTFAVDVFNYDPDDIDEWLTAGSGDDG